jgi:putative membrane protein
VFRRTIFLLLLTLAGLAVNAHPVQAHDGDPNAPWWAAWSLEPGVIVLIAAGVLLYARGWRRMVRRAGDLTGQLKVRTWAFAAGMLALAIALLSPVDGLAGSLFWVHMLQHNLLMLVVAPLLVLAYPLPQVLLGLPAGARRALGRGWGRSGWLRAAWRLISSMPVAWFLQAVLLWGWHAPPFYQASIENEWVHALQHFSFLGSALLFWWVVLHTFAARAAYRGAGILYLFTTAMHTGLLGALLTFSPRLWYPIYAGRAEAWGLTALADQQLAGTIMWVPGGLVYLAAALWMMKNWLDAMELRDEPALRKDQS